MNNENELLVEDKEKSKKDKKDIVKNVAIVFLSIMLVLTLFSNTITNYTLAQVATTMAQPGEIKKKIDVSGEIEAEDPYQVMVKESRKISGVAVKEGAHVKKDDILFYLDDIESEEFLAEKEKLDKLELDYDTQLFSGKVPDNVITNVRKGKKSSQDAHQSELKAATDRYDAALEADRAAEAQLKALTQQQASDKAGSDYNAATPGYTLAQAQADLEAAQASGDESRVEELQKKVSELSKDQQQLQNYGNQLDANYQKKLAAAQAEKDKTEAELKAAETEKQKVLDSLGTEIALTDLKDKIAESKAKLAKLEEESTGATIKSPVDGIISNISKAAGEMTDAAEPVAVIQVDGKDMTLECSVPTESAKKVKVGDKAEPTDPTLFKEFKAILKTVRNDKKDPANKKVLTFKIESPEVTPGQNVSLRMGEKPKHYDVVVPNKTIRDARGGKYILVLTEKHSPLGNRYYATKVDVNVVEADESNSAIEANLEDYSYIITTSNKTVNPGDQVRLSDE